MADFGQKEQYERWVKPAPISNLYPYAYNFKLVESIDELKALMSMNFNCIAFDTETTGLNLDTAEMVGFSFCFDGKNAYYVPIDHAPYYEDIIEQVDIETYEVNKDNLDYFYDDKKNGFFHKVGQVEYNDNLPEEAVEIFYNRMTQCKFVFMFNARFDMRVFEKHGFIKNNVSFEDRYKTLFYKYDMSKVNFLDVQALIFLSDTNVPYPNLKGSEEYFLGWRGASFKDTLGDVENFKYLKPKECYVYAATDALGTFLLAEKTYFYYQEPAKYTRYPNKPHSGILDNNFLYPLMMMEEELTQIDVDMLKDYSEYYGKTIDEVERETRRIAGDPEFNLGSPKQKNEAFKRLGIVTYEHDGSIAINKRGEAKADKEHLNMAIAKLEDGDERKTFMQNLLKYATLKKQKTTYADSFINMCKNSPNGNYLRFSYKSMVVPSGRLAAGGDKKNSYFADSNIQNITKPKIGMVYYVRYDELIKIKPNFTEAFNNPRQECFYNFSEDRVTDKSDKDKEKVYMILDWVFKESIWNIEGLHEMKIEGFKQNLNIRSAFCSDDDKYWVSCDFSAQELRVPALLTKEPLWSKTFEEGGDLHEVMARIIWGDENYDKEKRKRAKKCNFGILYGMTAKNFAIDFDISMDEAQKIVDDYKGGAPILFNWVKEREQYAKTHGIVWTMFGRPRRLGWYLNKDRSRGMQNFGIRSVTNTQIQGTGADILKISFLNIYNMFYRNSEKRHEWRKNIKFLNTVHDEINYNVSKQHVRRIVPLIISNMRLWYEDWDFPMKVGLDIGTRWGQTVSFDYDERPYVELTQENFNDYIGEPRYRKMSDEEAKAKNKAGLMKYVEDPNGNYVKNKEYLHIIAPAGEELSPKDYEVKVEDVKEDMVEHIERNEDKVNLFDDIFHDAEVSRYNALANIHSNK